MSYLKENRQYNSIPHTKFVTKSMGRMSVSTSAENARSHTRRRIATSSILTNARHPGELLQRKMKELGAEKGRETEAKLEVEIEGVRNLKRLIGGNSLHINQEIGLRE